MDMHMHEHLRRWDKCASACARVRAPASGRVCIDHWGLVKCLLFHWVKVKDRGRPALSRVCCFSMEKQDRKKKGRERPLQLFLPSFFSGIRGEKITLMEPRRRFMSLLLLEEVVFGVGPLPDVCVCVYDVSCFNLLLFYRLTHGFGSRCC